MRCLLVLVALAVFVGCSSAGSSGRTSPTSSADQSTPAANDTSQSLSPLPDFATATEAADGACQAFAQLLNDFETAPPSSDLMRLRDDGAQMQIASDQATRLESGTEFDQFSSDVDALVTYINQPDFPETGNILGTPVTKMQDNCL